MFKLLLIKVENGLYSLQLPWVYFKLYLQAVSNTHVQKGPKSAVVKGSLSVTGQITKASKKGENTDRDLIQVQSDSQRPEP